MTDSALPRYLQISEFLIREIAAGRLIDGARLPPERDMAADLTVSVGTLRKALGVLEERKLLERVQGSGNYIRQGPTGESVYALFRLELRDGGGLPRAEVLDLRTIPKPANLPEFGTTPRAARIRRLRFLNDAPVAVEEIWLDAGAGAMEGAISDSLYWHYRTALDLWIERVEDRVSIRAAPDWSPPAFVPQPSRMTGFVERFGWASGHTAPVEYSRTWFDPDRAVYVQRMR